MTNAIEQSKREMYDHLESVKRLTTQFGGNAKIYMTRFEEFLEAHFELLRQDHEALHETARKRFEDIQGLEAVNKDLIEQLGNMTERRDYFRNQVQAANHACKTRQDRSATPTQDSGDRISSASSGSSAAILVSAIDLCKRQVELWGFQEIKAKKAMRRIAQVMNGDPDLANALRAATSPDTYATWFLGNDKCMHSFPSGEQCVFCGVGK